MNKNIKIGDKFNSWTLVEIVKINRKNVHGLCTSFKCVCICGKESLIWPHNLSNSSQCRTCKNKKYIDEMIGRKFGKLAVISFSHSDRHMIFLCKCECGTERLCTGIDLRKNRINRCKKCSDNFSPLNKRHGMSLTTVYKVWASMIQRCNNKNHKAYKSYGGRGISICERWLKFDNFYEDMGEQPKGLQIDRIDNDGDYEPNNCRWVTPKANSNNRIRKKE